MYTAQQVSDNSWWKHVDGNTYSIITVTNTTATKPGWVPMVVYQDVKTDEIWSRPLSEWTEEKYRKVFPQCKLIKDTQHG